MIKLKYTATLIIVAGIIILGTSCNTSDGNKKDDEIVISASAVQYDFPPDNMLGYKGVIIDKDFIIYVFGWSSEFVKTLNNLDDVKVWTEFYNTSKRKTPDEWKLIQNIGDWYLVIYCNTGNCDLEAGIAISNCIKDDGHTLDYDKADMTRMSIKNLETPKLLIRKRGEGDIHQYYDNGTWSEIYEQSTINLN